MGSKMQHLPEKELLRMISEEPELTIGEYLDFLRELQSTPVASKVVDASGRLDRAIKEYVATQKEPASESQPLFYSEILSRVNEPSIHRKYCARFTDGEIVKIATALQTQSAIDVCNDLGMRKDQFRALCFGWRNRVFDVPIVSFKN